MGGGEAGAAQPSPRNETAEEARERRLRAIEERQRKVRDEQQNEYLPIIDFCLCSYRIQNV